MATTINKSNYDEIIASGKPVVIDFWAEWCGPCRAIAPIVEELAEEYEGKVIVGKCDVDDNNEIAAKYSVRSIPTIVFLKPGGELADKQVGSTEKSVMKQKIDSLL